MNIVSDAGPLIGFARINRLDILYALFDNIFIPSDVADECTEHVTKPGAILIHEAIKIAAIHTHPETIISTTALTQTLGKGEAAAITLAHQLELPLIIDGRRGRYFAKQQGVSIIGCGGLLLLAKQEKVVLAVKPLLEALHDGGYHLAFSLCDEILRLADEY